MKTKKHFAGFASLSLDKYWSFTSVFRKKRGILAFLILAPIMVLGQTQSENYIVNTVYKTPTTVSLATPTILQANQNITYYDGLGRAIQQIASKQSGSGKNIVTPIEYDTIIGRQVKEYLPYATSSSTGLNYETSANIDVLNFPQYVGQNPFTEKQVEASPLDRVLKQAAPGTDWAMNGGHEIKYDYLANYADAVKYYLATSVWDNAKGLYEISLSQNGSTNYPDNSLYKTVTKNENWTSGNDNTVVQFKNSEGKLILRRTFDNNVPHDTYYVFDQFGNQTYVIPPLVTNTATQMDGLCYQYKYDRYNRMVEKKLPGKQWEFIVYDKLDRVIANGPALSPFSDITGNGWLINKYDTFNRPIYTGWYAATVTTTSRASLQETQNNLTTPVNEIKTTSVTIDGVSVYYSNAVAPTTFKLLTVNYFDDYNFPDAPLVPATVLDDNSQPVYYNNSIKPKGMATGSWVRALESSTINNYEKSYILYDKKGSIVRAYNQNYLGGYTYVDSKLEPFSEKLLYTLTKHKRINTDAEILVKEEYTYTSQDRLLTHTHQINGGTIQLLASNTYNELGQLIGKNVGNTPTMPLQKINYNYNIRGWLAGINDVTNLQIGIDPKDLFAFKINYNSTVGSVAGVSPLYNGNISEAYWRTNSDNVLRKYGYQYDYLNRLKNANYQKPENVNPVTNCYNENLTYDKNGNILTLIRNGDADPISGTIEIDNLVYSYELNTNKLINVLDNSNNTSGFFDINTTGNDNTYDENGNLITGLNNRISNITYNHLNLPTKILTVALGYPTIKYIYNAKGVKLRKIFFSGGSKSKTTVTDYLEGFKYIQVTNNWNGSSAGVSLQYFPTSEGYVNNTVVNSITNYNYVFNYTDHLGNIRLSYQDINKDGTIDNSEILEENNYYPFGLKQKGYNSNNIQPNYKYKYNGKELQDEVGLNMYDYGARNYDPAIGRWMNVDPLAETSRRFSPYVYALNNPVFFIDPDGMQSQHFDNSKPNTGYDEYPDQRTREFFNGTKYEQGASISIDEGGITSSGYSEGDKSPYSTDVIKNPDGTYKVVDSKPDGDLNVYINENGKRTNKIIGKTVSEYSFIRENNISPALGAIIDLKNYSGLTFLNKLISDPPTILSGMIKLCPGNSLDFKRIGLGNKILNNYAYGGLNLGGGLIGTRRDVGNIGAGIVAGRSGYTFEQARPFFEALQRGKEPKVTTSAEKIGISIGLNLYIQDLKQL